MSCHAICAPPLQEENTCFASLLEDLLICFTFTIFLASSSSFVSVLFSTEPPAFCLAPRRWIAEGGPQGGTCFLFSAPGAIWLRLTSAVRSPRPHTHPFTAPFFLLLCLLFFANLSFEFFFFPTSTPPGGQTAAFLDPRPGACQCRPRFDKPWTAIRGSSRSSTPLA